MVFLLLLLLTGLVIDYYAVSAEDDPAIVPFQWIVASLMIWKPLLNDGRLSLGTTSPQSSFVKTDGNK